MPHFKPNFERPIDELTFAAGQIDDEAQLDLGSPQEFIALLEPEAIKALGQLAVQRAQQWIDVIYACRDELVEQDFIPKSRKRVVVMADAVPELRAGDV